MDEDGLPLVGSGIDLTKVPAIQQKRTVAFLNQFVVHTVQFLNRFSTTCEEVKTMKKYNLPVENMKMSLYSKLACEALACNALGNMSGNLVFILYCFKQEKLSALSLRIQQIETLLNILDAKLSSVPGLEDEISNTSVMNGSVSQTLVEPQTTNISPNVETSVPDLGQQKTNGTVENVITVAKDPHYARYLKMVQVGVPVMAIRNKMISEGLNPDLLETPDAPVPAWGDETNKGESSDSESSFSD